MCAMHVVRSLVSEPGADEATDLSIKLSDKGRIFGD